MKADRSDRADAAERPDADDPASFLHHDRTEGFLAGWMQAMASDLDGVERIVVMVEDTTGNRFRPVAIWPDGATDITDLGSVISDALDRVGPALDPATEAGGLSRVAAPIGFDGHVAAIVALAARGEPRSLSRRLSLGVGWISARLWENRAADDGARHARGIAALDALAVTSGARGLPAAAMALVGELAVQERYARVSFGAVRGRGGSGARVRLIAMSGAAWFRRRGTLVACIESAMEEALDQRETVCTPTPEGRRPSVDVACEKARAALGAESLAVVPVLDEGRPIGALMAEGSEPFDEATLADIEAVASLAGGVLALKRRQNAILAGRVVDGTERLLGRLGERRRPSWRAGAVLLLVVAALPFAVTGELRISARAALEGAAQQAAVAPFAGFVDEAPVKAGAVVSEGETLLRLEDRDLRLEAEKWRAELARLDQEARGALSAGDRAERALVSARARQAEAELALALGKLDRARVAAPVSGVVIEGDFSQKIGGPVERGELLFVVSPLDAFRVAVDVDARDVGLVRPGQQGILALAARPRDPIAIEVETVTAVARLEEGAQVFRVEAVATGKTSLAEAGLLPGMEGVARIHVGEASYAEIWTRRLRDWLQLQLFRWRP